MPGGKLLLPLQLCQHINDEMKATGREGTFSLKAMRRGGASALTAAGAGPLDVAAAGHWSALASQQYYLTNQAQRARAILVNKSLQPPSNGQH